ncbi:hypothetical protein CUMW_007760 [Citrus unshiu]|nr:hypothetical protein CUMW_007760 [Citrus unshiu]
MKTPLEAVPLPLKTPLAGCFTVSLECSTCGRALSIQWREKATEEEAAEEAEETAVPEAEVPAVETFVIISLDLSSLNGGGRLHPRDTAVLPAGETVVWTDVSCRQSSVATATASVLRPALACTGCSTSCWRYDSFSF